MCIRDRCEAEGGWKGLKARSDKSLKILEDWEAKTDWIEFLCPDASVRSNTGVTFRISDAVVSKIGEDDQRAFVKRMMKRLEEENACFDAAAYNKAPPGLRIWCGGTVEPDDVAKLTPWLDWAFSLEKAAL